MKDPDRIALLVRGQLLRRYPNTAVYAWKKRTTPANPDPTSPDHTQLLKNANGNPPNAAAIQMPVFSGVIEPDITFFGFDIDKARRGQLVLRARRADERAALRLRRRRAGARSAAGHGAEQQRPALKSALVQMRAEQQRCSPADTTPTRRCRGRT